MMILAEAALRSFLLTSAVWLALKLLRLKNPYSEMAVWSGVLFASLAMPLLIHWAPVETLPLRLYRDWTPIPTGADPVVAQTGTSLRVALTAAYAAPALLLTVRLGFGVFRSLLILRDSPRLQAGWVEGRDIRLCHSLPAPASIFGAILLPPAFPDWDEEQQQAVLAHESSHVARGDFYILLLADLHRALFWFNPLAWWLDRRLAELAEANSDAAALAVTKDRLSYARLLVDLASVNRPEAPRLAMANHATVRRRVERILAESGLPDRPTWRKLTLIAAGVIPAAMALAGTSAAIGPQWGSEAALRSHIEQVQRGEIDDSTLGVAGMGDGIRALLPQIRPGMVALGPILSVQFIGVSADGMDIYLVTHAHGTRRWQIHLTRTGKIQSMGFEP